MRAHLGQRDTAKTGGYRRSRDKKRVIPGMNPRDKRKPAVIRVSLGARSPHYSWFIQTRAARFYYFLVTSRAEWDGGGEGWDEGEVAAAASLSYRDITVTTTVSTLSISATPSVFFFPPCLLPVLLSSLYVCPSSSASFAVASVCAGRF